jgi:uncharacterized protein
MSRDAHITCPKCREILDPFVASGVQVDLCTACGGIWLDKGELGKLYGSWGIVEIERAAGPPRRQTPPSSDLVDLDCPACQAKLITLHVKGADLDGCVGCGGVWLDSGELGPALDSFGARGDPNLIKELATAVTARRDKA